MLGSTDPIASLTSTIARAYRIAQCPAPQLMVKVTRGFAPGNPMDRSSRPLCSVKSTQLDGRGDPNARSGSAQQSVSLAVTFALRSEAFSAAAPIDRSRYAIVGLSTHARCGGRDRCHRSSFALDRLWTHARCGGGDRCHRSSLAITKSKTGPLPLLGILATANVTFDSLVSSRQDIISAFSALVARDTLFQPELSQLEPLS